MLTKRRTGVRLIGNGFAGGLHSMSARDKDGPASLPATRAGARSWGRPGNMYRLEKGETCSLTSARFAC